MDFFLDKSFGISDDACFDKLFRISDHAFSVKDFEQYIFVSHNVQDYVVLQRPTPPTANADHGIAASEFWCMWDEGLCVVGLWKTKDYE